MANSRKINTDTNPSVSPPQALQEEGCPARLQPAEDPSAFDILVIGLNHKTAPVEIRERLAFSQEETTQALNALHHEDNIRELALLSTCNRVELIMAAKNSVKAVETAKSVMASHKTIPVAKFDQMLYILKGDDAVRHIFKVASSLDSLVVGEPQILGQIKDAYRLAIKYKTSSVILNRLFHRTFFIAKRVRTETGIGDHAVSVSYAAIELARKIFGNLQGKKALLVGAGEMAELAVEHLLRHQTGDLYVVNRTFEHGVTLARRFNAQAMRFEELSDCLKKVDIVISSTGAPDFVIRRDAMKKIMRIRKNRPLFFIDIAIPRDIDPQINHLSNVYVYDIDDLKGVIDENIEDRKKEALKAERMIDEAVIHFRKWYESLSVVPTIVAIRQKMDRIAKTEIHKTLKSLDNLSESDCQAIHRMGDALVSKMLHDTIMALKQNSRYRDKALHLDITRRLFNLDD